MRARLPLWFSVGVLMTAALLDACGGKGSGTSPLPITAGSPSPPAAIIFTPQPLPTVALTGANWSQFRYSNSGSNQNSAQRTITPANVASLAVKWTHVIPSSEFAQPLVVNGSVYVGTIGGQLLSLDESTGHQTWEYNIANDSLVSTPLYLNGRLYVPTNIGAMYEFDAASGSVIHSVPEYVTGSSIESSPIYLNNLIVVGQTDQDEDAADCITNDQVVGLDPNTLAVISSVNFTPSGTNGASVWSSPIADSQNNVYADTGNSCTQASSPFADSMVKMTTPSLSVTWHTPGPPDLHDWDFGSSPVFVGNLVVAGAKDGLVYAFDRASGALVWKTNAGIINGSIIGSLATDGQRIVVPFNVGNNGSGGEIVALDPNGAVLWAHPTGQDYPSYGAFTPAAISAGIAFIAYRQSNCSSNCDGVSAFNIATGQELWRYSTGIVLGGITIVDGGLFVGEWDTPNPARVIYRFTPGGQ